MLQKCLRYNGIIILDAPFGKSDLRPMHIVHSKKLWLRFRSIGFEHLWSFVEKYGIDGFIMRKKIKRDFKTILYLLYDYCFPQKDIILMGLK